MGQGYQAGLLGDNDYGSVGFLAKSQSSPMPGAERTGPRVQLRQRKLATSGQDVIAPDNYAHIMQS